MFRVKGSEDLQGFWLAERLVILMLFAVLLANLGPSCLNYWENRRLDACLTAMDSSPPTVGTLESLRRHNRIQFVTSLTASLVLAFCLIVLGWLRRLYRRTQQTHRQTKMLAHDILASMDRGIVTTNRDGNITSINSAGIQLLGVDFDCVGQQIASISTAAAPLAEIRREVVSGDKAVLDRDCNVDRDGHLLRLHIDGHVLKDTRGEALGCVIHLRNVTERILLEERMRRMERFLGLATLASGLHHEIKNPLAALSIHIQLLEEQLEGSEAVDELVGVLKTEVCRLNGVLESFRSFAHLQNLTLQPTDAFALLEKTVRLIRPQATQQGVDIQLSRPDRRLPTVMLDAEKFEQAVLNLVINALEAMPGGGTLTMAASAANGEFTVAVMDSGPGIPHEVQKSLFMPYFSTKTTGSGMGLALSEKLIGQHGGQISFHTGPQGTTFCIKVPLEPRDGLA